MGLIERLLARGDCIALAQGRLHIVAASGKAVPDCWLRVHQQQLRREIALATKRNLYIYCGYSTGKYGAWKTPGVTLRYIHLLSDEPAYLTFNAELHRDRTSKHGVKGSALPKGRFRVKSGYAFVKYWRRLGLDEPRRLSDFHDRMGKLAEVMIEAECEPGGKLVKPSVAPASLEPLELAAALGKTVVAGVTEQSDNVQTDARHWPDSDQTTVPDKEMPERPVINSFPGSFSACSGQCESSNKVSVNSESLLSPTQRVQQQSQDEWWRDYFSV